MAKEPTNTLLIPKWTASRWLAALSVGALMVISLGVGQIVRGRLSTGVWLIAIAVAGVDVVLAFRHRARGRKRS